MDINDIKHLAVERIFLVPDASEGQLGYAWCDDPAPGVGMDPSEAVEYVRKDVHEGRIAQLEADCAAHKAAEETQIALRQKADEREAALASELERYKVYCYSWESVAKNRADMHLSDLRKIHDGTHGVFTGQALNEVPLYSTVYSDEGVVAIYEKPLRRQAKADNEPPA